jgi:hypothetical protein
VIIKTKKSKSTFRSFLKLFNFVIKHTVKRKNKKGHSMYDNGCTMIPSNAISSGVVEEGSRSINFHMLN